MVAGSTNRAVQPMSVRTRAVATRHRERQSHGVPDPQARPCVEIDQVRPAATGRLHDGRELGGVPSSPKNRKMISAKAVVEKAQQTLLEPRFANCIAFDWATSRWCPTSTDQRGPSTRPGTPSCRPSWGGPTPVRRWR
jgi:hypothetical protein